MTLPRPLLYLGLVLLAVMVTWTSLYVGPGDLNDPTLGGQFMELRAVRSGAAFLAGAALSVGGVLVQGLFRNPLASPSILGTTAGATLGGQVSLLLFHTASTSALLSTISPEMVLPLGGLAGATLSLLLLMALQKRSEDVVVLLLLGFLLTSLFLSFSGLVTSIARERWELSRAMTAYMLGDVSGVGMPQIRLALPLIGGGVLATYLWGGALDMLLSGDEEAGSLGLEVGTVRRYCILWTAALSAAAVALGGNVSFVGLIVPHALRPLLGVSHRVLVPAAACLGGTFLVACDALTRALPTTTELPLGVVTGLVGAPTFLGLLLRSRGELGRA